MFKLRHYFPSRYVHEPRQSGKSHAWRVEGVKSITHLTTLCHKASKDAGWWDDCVGLASKLDVTPEKAAVKLGLIHSEVSEAFEGVRKDKMDDHLPHHKSVTVELADALIRIFDLAGAMNLPIGEAFVEKMAYNKSRADHKPENRAAKGGKKF